MAKIILVSFGGPRSLDEVFSFLRELLTDQTMVQTSLPSWAHRFLFSLIARLRAPSLMKKYGEMGGRSPIFEDTQKIAASLKHEVLPFYRYLPATHASFLEKLPDFAGEDSLTVITLFPQYSMTTVGSCRVWFDRHVPSQLLKKMRWIDSYATHPAFIQAWIERIRLFLQEKGIDQEEAMLLFSVHSLPQKIIAKGDSYQKECQATYKLIASAFPKAKTLLGYQSREKWGKWLEPTTETLCKTVHERKHVILIPIAFTTDHIETLYEIERDDLPLIRARGLQAHRCPVPDLSCALNTILQEAFR